MINMSNDKMIQIQNNKSEQAVMGRELYEFLEVKTKYSMWMTRMIVSADLEEGVDFSTCFPKMGSEIHGGQNKEDHILSMDAAKEISMLQHSDKGKQARRYFIECEKKLKRQQQLALALPKEDPMVSFQKQLGQMQGTEIQMMHIIKKMSTHIANLEEAVKTQIVPNVAEFTSTVHREYKAMSKWLASSPMETNHYHKMLEERGLVKAVGSGWEAVGLLKNPEYTCRKRKNGREYIKFTKRAINEFVIPVCNIKLA